MWMSVGPIAFVCIALSVPAPISSSADLPSSAHQVEFEDDQIRVIRLDVRPGETGATIDHRDSVIVFLTRDLEGRIPAAEAVWQPAGTLMLDNPGPGRFEALLVELKAAPSPSDTGLPPEASPASYDERGVSASYDVGGWPYDVRSVRVLENSRVTVTRQRFGPNARADLLHFHTRNNLFVYLSRGDVAGATARWGHHRVERGQVDVLPPNILHVFANVGSDPIEFITIHPK